MSHVPASARCGKHQMRTAILLSALLSLPACSMYSHRTIGQVKYQFAYGHFCGAGWPPTGLERTVSETRKAWKARVKRDAGDLTQDARIQILLDHVPPKDTIDALCYAHDFCYELSSNGVVCDMALHSNLIRYQKHLGSKDCWNLATDMNIAFFGKPWAKGSGPGVTVVNRSSQIFLGFPVAVLFAIAKLPRRPFLNDPMEGSCTIDGKSPADVVDDFETEFRRHGQGPINIPPLPLQYERAVTRTDP